MELIVVIGVTILLVVITGDIMVKGYRLTTFGQEQKDAIDEARKGILTMIREIREISSGDDGSAPITNAEIQTIEFFSDIDHDIMAEKVIYALEGTNFKRTVIDPCGFPLQYEGCSENEIVLSKYVQNGANPIFYYYNGDYPVDTANNPLPEPIDKAQIKLLKVKLEINVDPSRAPKNFELESFTHLRNLKENL